MDTEDKLEVLKKIVHLFNEEGLIWALGASAFLYLKGIVSSFSDLDLMIAEEDAGKGDKILSSLGQKKQGEIVIT